jgi:ribosomal protein S6
MKRYETIVIIDPDLSKEAETPIFERVEDLIPQYEGFLVETDDWGTKKLAYDIKKKNRGHYVRLDFCGDGALIQEMERFFRRPKRLKNPLKLKNQPKIVNPPKQRKRSKIWPFPNPAPEEKKEEFSTVVKCAGSVRTRALPSTTKIQKH